MDYEDILPLLKNFPRSTLAILDMAGHLLQIEQRKLFETLTKEWLIRTERYSDC